MTKLMENMVVMKARWVAVMVAMAVAGWMGAAGAIELPQFSSTSYSDWTYNHNVYALNADNILKNRIVLYVSDAGKAIVLLSPSFECEGGEVVNMDIRWIADQWQSDGFVPENTALTVAVLDSEGTVRDSVTYVPETLSRNNDISVRVPIPEGLTRARFRYACWKATASNCCAIRRMDLTVAPPTGDVNGDGEVSIADVNAIIDLILASRYEVTADINGDGEVTVADANAVIDIIVAAT